jgi:uncharacterized protein (TIGR03435 family)
MKLTRGACPVRPIAVATILAASAIVVIAAQTARAFDAASVKRNTNSRGLPSLVAVTGNRLSAPYVTARELIRVAYGVEDHQVVGGPGWIGTDHFEVSATIPDRTPLRAVPEMLRTLLVERFGLTAHTEKRDLPIYALLLAGQLGPQMRRSGPQCAPLTGPPGIPAPPPPPPPPAGAAPMMVLGQKPGESTCPSAIMRGFISARDMPVGGLVDILTRELRRTIFDRTELAGHYDIDLSFLPDSGPMTVNGLAINGDAPPLTTAVREQLGLRLDSARAPIDVVVIDRVTAPTDN